MIIIFLIFIEIFLQDDSLFFIYKIIILVHVNIWLLKHIVLDLYTVVVDIIYVWLNFEWELE